MPNVLTLPKFAQTFKMLYIMIEQQKFLAQYFMYFSKYGQLKFAINLLGQVTIHFSKQDIWARQKGRGQ